MADWAPKKVKYITNRDLLGEIQRSKATFCHFSASEYANYDAIVTNTEDLTPEFLAATLLTKLARLGKLQIASDGITSANVVFRVMSDQHLPEETNEKRRRKSTSGGWIPRTPFPPFQHFVLHGDLLIEVGRSHWKGDLENGQFSSTHGKITERLASMFLLLVEQYSRRGNWRGYSYLADMRGQALVQLSQVGLQFDESRSDNPFAWYTQIVKNSFRRSLLLEKRNQDIRDDLLVMHGAMPSYTRQVDDDLEQKALLESGTAEAPAKKEAKKRGRKPKPRDRE